MSTKNDPQGKDRKDRIVIEVHLVFEDGSGEESVYFTWRDVEAGAVPEIQPQDWMVEPRKSLPHPTDPIVYSTLVAAGREADARSWLRGLRGAPD